MEWFTVDRFTVARFTVDRFTVVRFMVNRFTLEVDGNGSRLEFKVIF